MLKKLIIAFIVLVLLVGSVGGYLVWEASQNLPKMITLKDYNPLLVSEVYDRKGRKIGEFSRQRRILVPYKQIPEKVIQAFVAAEDSSFFKHSGINYFAIARAFIENVARGKKAQGASTITQQVARSLLLTSEKTYIRKIKEIFLSQQMEESLSKQDILYLYLNQIYFGSGAYGIEMASKIYFRKSIQQLTIPEIAILAGLPQAPSRYSPIINPQAAKGRQLYVLRRMLEENYIKDADYEKYVKEPVKIFFTENYKEIAPFYLETLRQMLVKKLGEATVLDHGIRIYSTLDMDKQIKAQAELQKGLRDLDKRQGYRGPLKNISEAEAVAEILLKTRDDMMNEASSSRIISADGQLTQKGPLNLDKENILPDYIKIGAIVNGVVTKVDDEAGLVSVRFSENKGLIDFETMKWARKPDPNIKWDLAQIKKASEALKIGDVIQLRVAAKTFHNEKHKDKFKEFVAVELEQEPIAEASLISIDLRTNDVLAMVGGYDYTRSEYNRALQAARQTGSAFKALVYLAALDKNYTPSTPILDAPLVYEEQVKSDDEGQGDANNIKTWKPSNHSKKFEGDILFRNALIRSLNVPTVRIIENLGVDYVAQYARRLGIFSPLNMDFTLALGSSGVTLYEMTKVFSQIAKGGVRIHPRLLSKVVDAQGKILIEDMTLDERYETEIAQVEEDLEKKREAFLKDPTGKAKIFFENPDQLIDPSTAFLITNILQGAIFENGGTGGAARSIGRPAAGKTGSTSGYYDAWFVGYTPDIATGVWVGFDEEKSLGRGEVGGKSALPIWLEYMKMAHEGLPARGFPVPDGINFVNIDNKTGQLAGPQSKEVVRQAFREGTEPTSQTSPQKNQDFFKEEME